MTSKGVCINMTVDRSVFDPVLTATVGSALPYWTVTEFDGVKYNYSSLTPVHARVVSGKMNINCYVDADAILTANFSNKGLQDTFDLSKLTALTELNIGNNPLLTSIGDLSGLLELTNLTAYGNNLTSVGDLSALSKMQYLSLYNNNLSDIGEVTAMYDIVYIDLRNNVLINIGRVDDLTALIDINVSSNPSLTGIGSISKLANLETLHVSGCNIKSFGYIDSLPNLKTVFAEINNSLYTLIRSDINSPNISHLVAYTCALSQTQLDKILEVIYTNRDIFIEITPILSINNNIGSPPSGVYADVATPTTGLEYAYKLENDPDAEGFNTWSITY